VLLAAEDNIKHLTIKYPVSQRDRGKELGRWDDLFDFSASTALGVRQRTNY